MPSRILICTSRTVADPLIDCSIRNSFFPEKFSSFGTNLLYRRHIVMREGCTYMHNQPVVPETATSAFMPIPNMTDEEVMEQHRQRHADALPILFGRFYRLVLRVELRILRDQGEAEDVTQDIFLEIFNKADQFDRSRGPRKIWILQRTAISL